MNKIQKPNEEPCGRTAGYQKIRITPNCYSCGRQGSRNDRKNPVASYMELTS